MERFRQDGESKLAQFIQQALQRAQGILGREDAATVKEVCKQYGLSVARSKQVIGAVIEDWKQLDAEKKEKERSERLEEEYRLEEEARLEAERERRRKRKQAYLITGSLGVFGIAFLVIVWIVSHPSRSGSSPQNSQRIVEMSQGSSGSLGGRKSGDGKSVSSELSPPEGGTQKPGGGLGKLPGKGDVPKQREGEKRSGSQQKDKEAVNPDLPPPKPVFDFVWITLTAEEKIKKGVKAWVAIDGKKVLDWEVGEKQVRFKLYAGRHQISVHSDSLNKGNMVCALTITISKYSGGGPREVGFFVDAVNRKMVEIK